MHLFFRNEGDELWSVMPLKGDRVDIRAFPPRALLEGVCWAGDGVVIVPSAAEKTWSLQADATSGVRVNGLTLVGGLHVLQDRDEIRTGSGAVLFFSAETLPCVTEFTGGERPIFCGRCRQRMETGKPAVQCPCGIWYHQTEDLPCWTYAPTCALCSQTTALDAGYSWVPEG